MRKYLISQNGNFYKVNLHTHSNLSDGKWSPEEIKEWYKEHGYSAVAITDHDLFVPHNELTDESFVMLNGFELGMHTEKYGRVKCCHICLVAKDENNTYPVCLHRTEYMFGNTPKNAHLMKFEEDQPDTEREYSPEFFNSVYKKGREKGFFVTYNHPGWSNEQFEQYSHYEGMNAMEIYNHGGDDYSPQAYDDFLKQGKHIFCIASDDSHNSDKSLGGFTMIKAEKLQYKAITDALEKGDFYSSTGAYIDEIYVEDNRLYVCAENADEITFTTQKRVVSTKGNYIELDEGDIFVRATVKNKEGFFAFTNAYFIEEML